MSLPALSPGLAAGAFFLGLPLIFVPWLYDPAEAPRWAVLSAIPFIACLVPVRITIGHALGAAFIIWAAFTTQWSPGPYEGFVELWKIICLAGLFRIGSALPTLRPVFVGAGIALGVNGAIVLAQHAGWQGIPFMSGQPGGLFMNKNFVAEAAVLVVVGLAAYRVWWPIPPILPCLIYTGARGALIALGVAAAAHVWLRSRVLGCIVLFAVGCAAVTLWQTRTYEIVDSGRQRFVIWSDLAADAVPWGRGLGAFYVRFPEIAPDWDTLASRPSHAHNDLIEIAYETGPGILLVLGFLAFCLAGTAHPARLVLVAFLAESCLSFPTWFAVTGSLAAVCAGHLCRDRPSLRFHLAVGRMALYGIANRLDID